MWVVCKIRWFTGCVTSDLCHKCILFLDKRQSICHNSIQLLLQRCLTSFKDISWRTSLDRLHRLQNLSSLWELARNTFTLRFVELQELLLFARRKIQSLHYRLLRQVQEVWGHDQHCSQPLYKHQNLLFQAEVGNLVVHQRNDQGFTGTWTSSPPSVTIIL